MPTLCRPREGRGAGELALCDGGRDRYSSQRAGAGNAAGCNARRVYGAGYLRESGRCLSRIEQLRLAR